jgi:predicted metal-dependent phosphoesterase TrpH
MNSPIHGGLLAINEVSEIVLQFNGLSIFNILDNLAAVKARMVRRAHSKLQQFEVPHTFVFVRDLNVLTSLLGRSSFAKYYFKRATSAHHLGAFKRYLIELQPWF